MATETEWGMWDPIGPPEARVVLGAADFPWWIAGGYALEAFAGRSWREHSDLDIGLYRGDQLEMQALLADWELDAADPPGNLRPWRRGEMLPPGVHDIWAREGPDGPWRFQLMLNEHDDDEWIYRRDSRIQRSFDSLTWRLFGVEYLAPEVQLLFKSKDPRPKDEEDFRQVAPLLTFVQRHWLADALRLTSAGHSWIGQLTG
ncbi:MAG: amino acid transporter [Anaerolinea sp.]|nr:amino acid transporter [Anaerolinea sp.]